MQVALGSYQVVTWRQFGSDDPEGEFVWLDCRNVGRRVPRHQLAAEVQPASAQAALEAQRRTGDEAEIVRTVEADRRDDQRRLPLRVPQPHDLAGRGASDDVGDVIEGKHPGGGVTALGAGGLAHRVPDVARPVGAPCCAGSGSWSWCSSRSRCSRSCR